MVVKNVKVVDVEYVTKDKEGNPSKAPRIVLHYVGGDGTPWKYGALAAKLSSESRDELKKAKAEVEAGNQPTIAISADKVNNYWNLLSVGPASTDAPQTQNKSSYQAQPHNPSKGKETDTRIQVMNALTNAVVSLGAGKTPSEYKARVVEFVSLGNEVVDEVLNNKKTLPSLDTTDDVSQELGF